MVLNAVVAFSIANIFESAPKLAYENKVNGIALFITAKTKTCFHIGFSRFKYLFLKRMGKKINEAIINLVLTKATGPNSGVATLMNIKALPHKAPKKVNNIQYLISILKR